MSDQQMATHARVIRLKGEPARTDEVIKRWTNEILPLLKRQEGFRGASLVGNRKTGDGFSVTYWESERAMQNARPQVRPQAEEILNATGGKIVDDDECEVAVQERIQPAKAGVFTPRDDGRSRSSQGCRRHRALQGEGRSSDPSAGRRPHGAPFRESEVRPDHLRERLGDREGLQKSEAAVTALRDEAIKKIGGKSSKVEAFEVYFTEILTPAPVGR